MGTKRKATQNQLAPEPRRSRRNVDKCEIVEQINNALKLNGDEDKISSSRDKSKLPTKSNSGQFSAPKTVKRAIVERDIDFNKEILPIRTYGKSDKVTLTSVKQTSDEMKSRPSRLASKFSKVQKDIPKSEKTIKKIDVTAKKKGNLTINSPTKIEIRKTDNAKPAQSTVSTVEAGGQKKIIINKIIMPPDAYNQMIRKQNANQSQKSKNNATSSNIPISTSITTQVPVQHLINNLQTNLGPILLSSGIKVIPNLTVTNPQQSSVITTANVVPINQVTQVSNQSDNKDSSLRIVTTLPNQQITTTSASNVKQLQLPIIIKSIVSPTLTQQPVICTQTKTTASTDLVNKVNPISNVKAPNVNKTPERVVVNIDTNKKDRTKKTRVSFNFDKNTSTNIKPITNELPIAASNVLMTSTPKQSIIKKPKVFDLPCTPITNNLTSKRVIRTFASTAKTLMTNPNESSTIAQQIKNKIETVRNSYSDSPSPISIKCCKQSQCDCWSNLPKDDLEQVKRVFKSLNAPKRMLYIYCTTIKINEKANFDFEKYVFYIRTKNGFVQVCHRVYMDIFEKQNLSFVETAFKKCDL